MTEPMRSALFVPASNRRAIEKAAGLACDAVILDLEDGVAPTAKDAARAQAVAALAARPGPRPVAVRINALDTAWGQDDLRALADTGVDAIVIPKFSRPQHLVDVRAGCDPSVALWAMIESAAGILRLPAIVEGTQPAGLAVLIAGTNDIAKDLRCRPGERREPLVPALMQIVIAARATGLLALDGVFNAFADTGQFAAECRQGAALGFDGKTLIHPSQIADANRIFAPSDEDVAWARSVVDAFHHPGSADRGAIQIDGVMVERLHLVQAERILAAAADDGGR